MSHEPQDLSGRGIGYAGAVLGVSVVVVLAICFLLWRHWSAATPEPAPLPPQPRLQPRPSNDLQAFRREQASRDGWGWVDEKHGVARIPVERAMRVMSKEASP